MIMVNYERLYHACVLESSRLIDVLDARAKENPDSRQGCFEASSRLQKLLLEWEEQYIEEVEDTPPVKALPFEPCPGLYFFLRGEDTFRGLAFELFMVEVCVIAVLSHKLLMGALLDDLSAAHHQN